MISRGISRIINGCASALASPEYFGIGDAMCCGIISSPSRTPPGTSLKAEPAASAFLAAHPGKRHRYFHHLNSSQAFAFNLFFPYFSGEPEVASALLRALGQEATLAGWEPEAVPAPDEETNIEVFWTTADGVRTFCEVKLSEADFGKAADPASATEPEL
jgi:hypothetical protein